MPSLNIDFGRLFKDLTDIVAGLRTFDWAKVLAAISDILAMIAGIPMPVAAIAGAAIPKLTPAMSGLSAPETLSLIDLTDRVEALADEIQKQVVKAGGSLIAIILAIIRAILGLFSQENVIPVTA